MTRVLACACALLSTAACGVVPSAVPAHCQPTASDADADDDATNPLSVPVDAAGACLDDDAYPHGPSPVEPGTCFRGKPPAPGTYVIGIHDAPTCTTSENTLFPSPPPPATLHPELGRNDSTGAFLPWHDGDWAPVFHGFQGPFLHVATRFRVQVPGHDACRVDLDTATFASIDCIGQGESRQLSRTVWQSPELFTGPGRNDEILTILNLKPQDSWQYCGQVLDLRLLVRIPATDTWGEGHVRLRLYDYLAASQCGHPSP